MKLLGIILTIPSAILLIFMFIVAIEILIIEPIKKKEWLSLVVIFGPVIIICLGAYGLYILGLLK